MAAGLIGLATAPVFAQPSPATPSPPPGHGPAIATPAPAPAPAAAPPAPTLATLTVTARGEVTAVPDIANLSIGVTSEGQTAAVALAANAKAASAMIAEIEAAGIPKSDIATTRLAISPTYATRTDQGVERQEISGYTVTNSLTLRIRPIERAGPLIDVLVGRGANAIDSITFEVSDAEKRLDQARIDATRNARARAELLAGAAGVRLGRLVDLREGVSAPPVLPNPSVRFEAASAAPPVEPGETRLTASVTATYEILTGAAQ